MAITLGHQLAEMDRSAKSEPNGIVVERKWTTVYKTKATVATGGGGKDEKKIKKKKVKKKKILDNIPAIEESLLAAEAETDQEQCGYDTKKKIRI